jgi:hypothetical protein
MKVVRLAESIQLTSPIQAHVLQPRPGSRELLIQVHAAGVMRTELSRYLTSHRLTGKPVLEPCPALTDMPKHSHKAEELRS